jgi:hypothetical protein
MSEPIPVVSCDPRAPEQPPAGAVRSFEHGAAECLTQSPLFICCRGKIEFITDSQGGPDGHPRGHALALIEFLTRMIYRPPPSERRATRWSCVLPEYPQYLPLLSRLFPGVQFYAYSAPDPHGSEYAPDDPASRAPPYRPAECEGNVTALCQASHGPPRVAWTGPG